MKKFVCLVIFLSMGVSLGLSQTLAEIAKKERERRESLKGKKGIVVTNADLMKLRKKPALEVPGAELRSESEETPLAESSSETADETPTQTAEAGAAMLPVGVGEQVSSEENLKVLQERWEKAKEYVELLILKMGALWQEFSNLDNPSAKEPVRLAIAETFLKLQNAQEEEGKARQELEKFLGQMKKESTPSLWIK